MKTYLILFVFASAFGPGEKLFAGDGGIINEKLILAFNKTFPQAEKVSWQEINDRYMVHFQESNIRVIVNYDRDGNFLNSTRYYAADNLPLHLLYKIIKKYPGKKIFGVTEITGEESIDYYIKLEDETNWLTIKSDAAGSFELVEKLKKQE